MGEMTRRQFMQALVRSRAQVGIDYARASARGLCPVLTDYELSIRFGVSIEALCNEAMRRNALP